MTEENSNRKTWEIKAETLEFRCLYPGIRVPQYRVEILKLLGDRQKLYNLRHRRNLESADRAYLWTLVRRRTDQKNLNTPLEAFLDAIGEVQFPGNLFFKRLRIRSQ